MSTLLAEPAALSRFSVFAFSSAELDQIVQLVRYRAYGYAPLDARCYTRQVRTYAERWHLVDRRDDGRLVPGSGPFDAAYDIPVEALWRLVQPMFHGQRTRGRSLARDPAWEDLNIWPEGHRYATDTDAAAQRHILHVLARTQYVLVQMAGSMWEITNLLWTPAAHKETTP